MSYIKKVVNTKSFVHGSFLKADKRQHYLQAFQDWFCYFRRKERNKLKIEASDCKHFQNGYCKFCDHCNKKHINLCCAKQNTVHALKDTQRFLNTSAPIADLVKNEASSMSPQRNKMTPLSLKARSIILKNVYKSCHNKSTLYKIKYLPWRVISLPSRTQKHLRKAEILLYMIPQSLSIVLKKKGTK